MTFTPHLPRPPRIIATQFDRLRQRLDARLENPRIPDFTLPPALARILALLPSQPPTLALTLALNLALDRILPRDTLEALAGRWLRLIVADAGLTLDFHLGAKGFRPGPPSDQVLGRKPDLTLSARTRDYLALALREEDADTLFFSRRLRMEGNTDLGLLVKNTLDAVDWDALKDRLQGFLPPGAPDALHPSTV